MDFVKKENFWRAIGIYIQKPHVVNRKVCGFHTKRLLTKASSLNLDELESIANIILQNKTSNTNDKVEELAAAFSKKCSLLNINTTQDALKQIFLTQPQSASFVLIRTVFPKSLKGDQHLLEIILLDKFINVARFIPQMTKNRIQILPQLSYSFILDNKQNIIELKMTNADENYSSAEWLSKIVHSRLNKWAKESLSSNSACLIDSLDLIDVQEYNILYQGLKAKYAQNFINAWNESTDPLKFIHEDIGIACYLLLLWKKERLTKHIEKKQTFLDMGCGNGLLVHILTMEGHEGAGFDIKKRRIWDSYPSNVILKEMPIEPSSKKLFPEYDWLIGNHSDELTPWIPVIAAKSCYGCRFFLLPCCSFDFFHKFRRVKSTVSQYTEYIDYIQDISTICGFHVKRDKLRIPSTKRICLVGIDRAYHETEQNKISEKIETFISQRNSVSTLNCEDPKLPEFKIREKFQEVKNCTYINPAIKDELVNKVAFLLLQMECSHTVNFGAPTISWKAGGQMTLKEVAESLSPMQLHHLKKESGGLQTLLKNHRNVFDVKNRSVSLRIPQPLSQLHIAENLLRSKPCWFFFNHPNGCPFKDDNCAYSHVK